MLPATGTLSAGQSVSSPDGHDTLVMQSDGNLVDYAGGTRALWSSHTSREPGAHAVMQRAGNLVVYGTGGQALYSTNSRTAGCPRLVVQPDGNLVIYATRAIWASGTIQSTLLPGEVLQSGWSIYSPKENVRLTMRSDGDLVLADGAGHLLWTTKTAGHPGAHTVLDKNGNLVVATAAHQVLWASNTLHHAGDHLALQSDGNLVLYASGGHALFTSATDGKASGGSVAPAPPAPVACPAPPSTTTTTTTTAAPTPPPPAPVVSTPVTTPVPTPAPVHVGLRPLRVRMAISWTWSRAVTRVRRVRTGSLPGRTRGVISCHGRGCPRHGGVIRATGARRLRRLLTRLSGRRFRSGQELLVSLTAPGYRAERVVIRFRWGRVPQVRLARR